MNSLPEDVVSPSLADATWNNSNIVRENAAQGVQTLEAQCSAVDSLNLLVYPVVLGEGKRFFGGHSGPPLTVTASPAFSSGVLLLHYQPLDAA